MVRRLFEARGGGGVLPYMSYIGMCRCEGYGFQRVYSRIGVVIEMAVLALFSLKTFAQTEPSQ